MKSTPDPVPSPTEENPPPRPPQHAALFWLSPHQREVCAAIAERAGLSIAVVGSPQSSDASTLATALSASPASDLRASLVSAPVQVAVIADPGAFAADDAADKQALLEARDRGLKVVTFEPMPAAMSELAADVAGPGAWARLCPMTRLAPAFRDVADLLTTFGPVRAASIQALGRPEEGSLGARLIDAMDLLLRFMAEPESVDASFSAPVGIGKALRPIPGETLRGRSLLRGDICAAVRFSGGRAATILASDQGTRHERTVTLLGEGGRIRIDAHGVEWLGPGGEQIEKHKKRARRAAGTETDAFATQCAAQIVSLLTETGGSPGSPADYGRALALAQTALLSARTGEGESPATLQRLAGVA